MESHASVLDMTSDGRIIHISALSCCCQSVMVSALHWCICFGMNILLILELIVRSIVRIITRFCWNEICFRTWGNYQIIEHFIVPQKIAMLRSATFAQLSRFHASAQFLLRSATFAQLWLILGCFFAVFFHFGNILGQNGKWNLWAPTIFPTFVAVCLKMRLLNPYFFHPMPLG